MSVWMSNHPSPFSSPPTRYPQREKKTRRIQIGPLAQNLDRRNTGEPAQNKARHERREETCSPSLENNYVRCSVCGCMRVANLASARALSKTVAPTSACGTSRAVHSSTRNGVSDTTASPRHPASSGAKLAMRIRPGRFARFYLSGQNHARMRASPLGMTA